MKTTTQKLTKRAGTKALLAATALTLSMGGIPTAFGGDFLTQALDDGKIILDMRYRLETVEQDGISNEAVASTLRTRFGFETGEFNNFKVLIEGENISSIGDEEYYDFRNGNLGVYPVVADPDGTELNRAQITFTGAPDTTIIVGRQRINLGTQRFVGAVGFRQNEQTYDAVLIKNKSIPNTTVTYGYVDKVHRIFGDDSVAMASNFDSEAHIVNVDFALDKIGTLTGYGYWLDLEQAATLSTATYGARFAGKQKINEAYYSYMAEYAKQTDHADNLGDFDLDYYNFELGFGYDVFGIKVGYEVLGGDGVKGFSTPLATLHKFQGFADKFLGTPADGIRDLNASVSYKLPGAGVAKGFKIAAWYHDYEADNGGADLGSEWDFLLAATFEHGLGASLKYASYEADTFSTDTDKLWVTLSFKY